MMLRADEIAINNLIFESPTCLAISIIRHSLGDPIISVLLLNLSQNSILILRAQFYSVTTIEQKPEVKLGNTKNNNLN